MSDEQKISQRYRELPREEPPRALDDAILAASRRAAETRPAPLVVPSGRQRWYFPLAAAAIIVLAVAVTVHVERERPDAEVVVQAEPAAKAPAEERAAKLKDQFVPDPKPAPARAQRDAAGVTEMRARESTRADEGEKRMARRSESAPARLQAVPAPAAGSLAPEVAQPSALAKFAGHSPEQWLQGIADLKRQGRHDEAEKSLAEFRKRYPGYRIPEAILQKFEK